jgi:hypothetical protein
LGYTIGLLLFKKVKLGDYFVKNVEICRNFDGGHFFELIFVNTHFAGFFVVWQELTRGVARPNTVIFEGFRLLMLVKRGDSFFKEIFKKLNF